MTGIRRKWQRVAVCLVLAALLLSALPGTAVAAPEEESSAHGQRFSATATIEYIGEGKVIPVDGGWLVRNRPMGGSIAGDIEGTYEFVYSGLVKLDQSGVVHGKSTITTDEGDILSKMTVILGPVIIIGFTMIEEIPHPVGSHEMKGIFHFLRGTGDYKGVRGLGTLEGTAYPILDPSGEHVIGFADGTVIVQLFDDGTDKPKSVIELKGVMRISSR